MCGPAGPLPTTARVVWGRAAHCAASCSGAGRPGRRSSSARPRAGCRWPGVAWRPAAVPAPGTAVQPTTHRPRPRPVRPSSPLLLRSRRARTGAELDRRTCLAGQPVNGAVERDEHHADVRAVLREGGHAREPSQPLGTVQEHHHAFAGPRATAGLKPSPVVDDLLQLVDGGGHEVTGAVEGSGLLPSPRSDSSGRDGCAGAGRPSAEHGHRPRRPPGTHSRRSSGECRVTSPRRSGRGPRQPPGPRRCRGHARHPARPGRAHLGHRGDACGRPRPDRALVRAGRPGRRRGPRGVRVRGPTFPESCAVGGRDRQDLRRVGQRPAPATLLVDDSSSTAAVSTFLTAAACSACAAYSRLA